MASEGGSTEIAGRLPAAETAGRVRCSFCGKRRDQVESMVAGSRWDVAICNECVDLCAEIIAEQRVPAEPPQTRDA